MAPPQQELEGVAEKPDVAAIVAKTASAVVQQTIDIPRILVVPKGEVTSGFNAFKLSMTNINYQPVERDILIQYLVDHRQETLASAGSGQTELRLEDYLVRALVDFDDVSYDNHADLLYDLAGQMVAALLADAYLKDATRSVECASVLPPADSPSSFTPRCSSTTGRKAVAYEVKISAGVTALKECAYSAPDGESPLDFRHPPADKSKMAQMICLADSKMPVSGAEVSVGH